MAVDFKVLFSRETESLLYLLGYQAHRDSYNVYVVGSFVRDLILGKDSRIIDVLVEGDVVSYVRNLQRSLPGKMQYSELFGTATFHIPGPYKIKLTTLKSEVYYLSEEPASLERTLKNELFKRDFTVNTLAMKLNPCNFCKLHDFFGGKQDLSEGNIRALYSLSFVNEPLRLLSALRLEQRFGFKINEDTANLMHTAITAKVLQKVSRERIGHELRLIFAEPAPSRVVGRLHELGLWQQVFPRLSYNETIPLRLRRLELIRKSHQLAENRTFRYNTFIISVCVLFYGLTRHDILYLSHILRLKRNERQEVMEVMERIKPVLDGRLGSMEAEGRVIDLLEKQCTEEGGVKRDNVSFR